MRQSAKRLIACRSAMELEPLDRDTSSQLVRKRISLSLLTSADGLWDGAGCAAGLMETVKV